MLNYKKGLKLDYVHYSISSKGMTYLLNSCKCLYYLFVNVRERCIQKSISLGGEQRVKERLG